MSYESGAWVSPATSAFTEITGALLENEGVDSSSGEPQANGQGGLDPNWLLLLSNFDDTIFLPIQDPTAGFRWIEAFDGNDFIQGGENGNIIYAGDGNDSIGGGSSANILLGEADNDYVAGNFGEDLMSGGTGNDSMLAYGGNDILVGEEGDDTLDGSDGNDLLQGGAGKDSVSGGFGDDFYYVDDTLDTIVENASSGEDVLVASLDFSLAALPNVEHLSLTGTAIHGTGNAGNNIVQGSDANNELNGMQGTDILAGGIGHDRYTINGAEDFIVEFADEGTDEARSTADFSLKEIDNVENLTLIGNAIRATGNELDNALNGNAKDNVLTGVGGDDSLNGGVGKDTLVGGEGDDFYWVDNAKDSINEARAQGTDTVTATVNHILATGVEDLTLSGSEPIKGSGNGVANVISGNNAANVVDGKEGDDKLFGEFGNDTLIGGEGADTLTGARAATFGKREIDQYSGGIGKDLFVLGNEEGRFYDDGARSKAGRTDYASIIDFDGRLDRLVLNGTASQYYLGASGFSASLGVGLFLETGANDELIAVIKSDIPVTVANTLGKATFV